MGEREEIEKLKKRISEESNANRWTESTKING